LGQVPQATACRMANLSGTADKHPAVAGKPKALTNTSWSAGRIVAQLTARTRRQAPTYPMIMIGTSAEATRPMLLIPPRTTAPASTIKARPTRSEEHTSELQSRFDLVCRLLLA